MNWAIGYIRTLSSSSFLVKSRLLAFWVCLLSSFTMLPYLKPLDSNIFLPVVLPRLFPRCNTWSAWATMLLFWSAIYPSSLALNSFKWSSTLLTRLVSNLGCDVERSCCLIASSYQLYPVKFGINAAVRRMEYAADKWVTQLNLDLKSEMYWY